MSQNCDPHHIWDTPSPKKMMAPKLTYCLHEMFHLARLAKANPIPMECVHDQSKIVTFDTTGNHMETLGTTPRILNLFH